MNLLWWIFIAIAVMVWIAIAFLPARVAAARAIVSSGTSSSACSSSRPRSSPRTWSPNAPRSHPGLRLSTKPPFTGTADRS
jgi:hypothetical protein